MHYLRAWYKKFYFSYFIPTIISFDGSLLSIHQQYLYFYIMIHESKADSNICLHTNCYLMAWPWHHNITIKDIMQHSHIALCLLFLNIFLIVKCYIICKCRMLSVFLRYVWNCPIKYRPFYTYCGVIPFNACFWWRIIKICTFISKLCRIR